MALDTNELAKLMADELALSVKAPVQPDKDAPDVPPTSPEDMMPLAKGIAAALVLYLTQHVEVTVDTSTGIGTIS